MKTLQTKTITLNEAGTHPIELTESGHYVIELNVPGVEAVVGGVFSVTGSDNLTIEIVLHHKAAHTRAETTLKGVAADHSSISFKGKIVIDENCPDTQSFLTERILLLSDTARAEAVPDLEILSDDVSCSHAASITNIPESQLFYLMSRGLSRQSAEELIVAGFLGK